MLGSLGIRKDHAFDLIIHSGGRGDAHYIRLDKTAKDLPVHFFPERYEKGLKAFKKKSKCRFLMDIGPVAVPGFENTRPGGQRRMQDCTEAELVRVLIEYARGRRTPSDLNAEVVFNFMPAMSEAIFRVGGRKVDLYSGLAPAAAPMVARETTISVSRGTYGLFKVRGWSEFDHGVGLG